MSWLYWGESNNPNKNDNQNGDAPTRRKVRVSSLSYGHSPDKRGERKDKYGKQPIVVRRGRVVDGNDRLYYARERGDTWIEAEVWE